VTERRPDIVMILTDDHAAHAIGAYGSAVNTTPRIDEIGRLGRRFDNCFATNSLCSPSRASNHKAPHRPWIPSPRHRHLYTGPIPLPPTFGDDYGTRTSSARRAAMRIAEHLTLDGLKVPPPAGLSYEDEALWKYQRFDRYKLIYFYNDGLGLPGCGPDTYPPEWELYDLQADPAELRNVYHEPAYAEVRDRLAAAMWREQAALGDQPHPSQPKPVML
jgi:arylsulfatase A-like enzyme